MQDVIHQRARFPDAFTDLGRDGFHVVQNALLVFFLGGRHPLEDVKVIDPAVFRWFLFPDRRAQVQFNVKLLRWLVRELFGERDVLRGAVLVLESLEVGDKVFDWKFVAGRPDQ